VGEALTGTSAMITLSFPIFDRLTGWGRFRSHAQAQAAADAGLEQVRRTARSDWESSRFSFETALGTALAREKTVSVAQRLFQDGLRRFRSGKATANELAIDRDRELRSELLSVQGWASAHVEFTRYCHAQGKSVLSCP
jgi:outer membrane protein TolC